MLSGKWGKTLLVAGLSQPGLFGITFLRGTRRAGGAAAEEANALRKAWGPGGSWSEQSQGRGVEGWGGETEPSVCLSVCRLRQQKILLGWLGLSPVGLAVDLLV